MYLKLLYSHQLIQFCFVFSIKRDETENWLKLPGCQHVTGTECKFSLLNTSMYVKMKFRVRAETGKIASSWTEVDPFIPFLRGKRIDVTRVLCVTHSSVWCRSHALRPFFLAFCISGSPSVVAKSL